MAGWKVAGLRYARVVTSLGGSYDDDAADRELSSRPHAKCILLRFYDLDLCSMTLVFDLDLDIAKMYVHTDNEVCKSRHLKVRARTGQTLTHTD